MTQPPGGLPGQPDTEPVPLPEPDPPQPLPPTEPVPRPEPPHAEPPTVAFATAAGDPPTEPIPTGPTPPDWPTQQIPADWPTAQTPADLPTAQTPADPPAASGTDFIDAAPAEEAPYPPIGAFPDEQPGSEPTEQLGRVAAEETETQHRVSPDQTELLRPVAEQSTAWQPPWHAQHESPGEWQYQPPEHLAREHSPPFGMQDPAQVAAGPPPPPWQVVPAPVTDDRRRKTGLWVSVALTTTLLLCGGGAFSAYLLLKEADSGGAPDPATAVDEFMTAVYTQQDAAAANDLVCRESRDKDKLAARVNQIKGYANRYDGPSFAWGDPAVSGQSEERATVSVQLTMSTDDEKTARQKLTFTTVRKSGWLVCEIAG